MKKKLDILKAAFRRVSHPVFYIALLFSTLMWFVIKLSIDYRETVIIPVTIEKQNFEVVCNVQSSGYRLMYNNFFPASNKIELTLEEVGINKEDNTSPYFSVSPYVLYNVISSRITNFRVLNVSTSLHIKRND